MIALCLNRSQLKEKFSAALKTLLQRGLAAQDGLNRSLLAACEKKLKLKLPRSLWIYYELAGNLSLNTEHNRFYAPKQLERCNDKLVFMEENQVVVFWALQLENLDQPDPEVFQGVTALHSFSSLLLDYP